jgi:hypothetical protein
MRKPQIIPYHNREIASANKFFNNFTDKLTSKLKKGSR